MPNYTSNSINMKGIGKAKELYNDGDFDFNKIIPMPEDLKDTISGGRVKECVAYYLIKSCTKDEFFRRMKDIYMDKPFRRSWTKTKIAESILKRIGNNPRMYDSESKDIEYVDEKIGSYIEHDHHHTPEEIGKFYWELYEKYGFFDWYDWSCHNWDTKWNAFDTYICDNDNVSFTTAWTAPDAVFMRLSEMYSNTEICTESYYEEGGCYKAKWLNGEQIYESWEDDDDEEDHCYEMDDECGY